MGVGKRQQAVRAMRGQMWSPGRPSTARREDRVRFWEAIARGVSSDDGLPHFHTTLLHAAGNPLLSIMTPPVFRVLQLRYLRDDPPDFWRLVSDEHDEILVAVADRDADAAEAMMRKHLQSLRSSYEAGRSLEQPEPD